MSVVLQRGVVAAHGFQLVEGIVSEAERRRRILAEYLPGARVLQTPLGLLLWRPSPISVDCAYAPGIALVLSRGALTSLHDDTFSDRAAAVASLPPGAIVLAHNGTPITLRPLELEQVDPAAWLSLNDWELLSTTPLGERPPPPTVTDEMPQEPAFGPDPSEDQKRMSSSWDARAKAPDGEAVGFMGRLLGSGRSSGEIGRPNALARLLSQDGELIAALREEAQKHIPDARMADRVARMHAHYIRRIIELIDDGDIDNALRHALPIDMPRKGAALSSIDLPDTPVRVDAGGAERTAARSMVRPPAPISLRALGVPEPVLEQVRERYRAAASILQLADRIETACYVLADLLNDAEAAVTLLENHGRLKTAAELAEARQLAPGLVARQWFVAGEEARALRVIRRGAAFTDAVRRLEERDPSAAGALRVLWARFLASSGDYEAAVRVGWTQKTLEDDGSLEDWIEQTIVEGGPAAARMLVFVLPSTRAEDTRRHRLDQALTLLADESEAALPTREALVEALALGVERAAETTWLAREAVRTVLCEQPRGRFALNARTFASLVDRSEDASLRSDLPPYVEPRTPARASLVAELLLDAAGTLAVYDAALLPDGRLLVALGEAGVRVLKPNGETERQFDHPAHRLVVPEAGNRVILVGLRGNTQRLCRLDLSANQAAPWCEAQLQDWADEFDGSQWFAMTVSGSPPALAGSSSGATLMAIDALSNRFEALARTTRARGEPICLRRSGGSCAFLMSADEVVPSFWCGRSTLGSTPDDEEVTRLPAPLWKATGGLAVAPDGACAMLMVDPTGREGVYARAALKTRVADKWTELLLRGPSDLSRRLALARGEGQGDVDAPWPQEEELAVASWAGRPRPCMTHDFIAGPLRVRGGVVVTLISRSPYGEVLRVYLPGARDASVRLSRRHLVTCDTRGRVAVVDVRTAQVTHRVRCRA